MSASDCTDPVPNDPSVADPGRAFGRDLDQAVPELANPVLDVIERRSSTRVFLADPVTDLERQAILHAASRAPSAGAMMFYSIVGVDDPQVRARLCHLCDDQPFMLKAPLWLLFVVDNRKWLDLYEQVGCYGDPELERDRTNVGYHKPGLGELLLACEDAMAAAQTAVIAAESLGIGSCYIGDVLEHGEAVAELLHLPPATLPLALLVFGHKKASGQGVSASCTVDDLPAAASVQQVGSAPDTPDASGTQGDPRLVQTPHPVRCLYMQDAYQVPTPQERSGLIDELDGKFTPHAMAAGAPAGERVRKLYHRKHTSDFMAEMNRSAAWWVDRWCEEASYDAKKDGEE